MPFPYPKGLLDPGIEPRFLALQLDSLLAEPPGKSLFRNKKLLETILGINNSPTEQGGGEVLLGLDHLPWPITLKCLLLNIRIYLFFPPELRGEPTIAFDYVPYGELCQTHAQGIVGLPLKLA